MIEFSNDEIVHRIAALGKHPDARFLCARLMAELLSVSGAAMEPCALSYREGRRSLAADILSALEHDSKNDDRDGTVHHPRTTAIGRPFRGTERRVPIEPIDGYGD